MIVELQRDDNRFSGYNVYATDLLHCSATTTDSRAMTWPAKDGIAMLDSQAVYQSGAWRNAW